MKRKIVAGTRGSRLALIQTEAVVSRLKQAETGLEIEIKQIVTAGDRDRRSPLDRLDADVFVKELEAALLGGDIDIAVHSLKDMPTKQPAGLEIIAVTARVNPADVLISQGAKLAGLPPGAGIGTGSLRRTAQLAAARPDLRARPVRGNIETRLRRLDAGEYDGLVLAAAGLIRLGLEDRITEYLPLDIFLPAAGQGALAVEGRRRDAEVAGIAAPIDHPPTRRCVTAERAFLEALGCGCRAPVGVLGTTDGRNFRLEAMAASPDGRRIRRASLAGGGLSSEELGVRLARRLLETGAGELLKEAE